MTKLPKLYKTLAQAYGARKAKRLIANIHIQEALCGIDLEDCSEVSGCFYWTDSLQGHSYWEKINVACCRVTGAEY